MAATEFDAQRAAAMMSVYYYSLAKRLELRGAPAVLLPSAVRPIPLHRAIDVILNQDDGRRVQALWTLLRAAPGPQQARDKTSIDERYPAPVHALADDLKFGLDEFDRTRGYYRWESLTFANALSAYAYGAPAATAMLEGISERAEARWGSIDRTFGDAVEHFKPLGGVRPEKYVATIAQQGLRQSPEASRDQLRKLEDDVGLNLRDLVVDLADAMAFMNLIEKSRVASDPGMLTAYPAAAVATQDTRTLATTVTVTALVRAENLQQLTTVLDPINWGQFSDAFRRVTYVEPTGRRFAANPAVTTPQWPSSGLANDGEWLVQEEVQVPSGLNPRVIAAFENILRVTLRCDEAKSTADLAFSLFRSKRSRYLWDEGPGGILVDAGGVKIRPMATDVWRVTMRKTLRFADRTPSSADDSPLQFGQSLNYLTPAMLIWWVQTDLYNLRSEQREEDQDGS